MHASSRKEQVRGAHLWCKKQAYSDSSDQLSQSAIKRINFHAMESSIRSGYRACTLYLIVLAISLSSNAPTVSFRRMKLRIPILWISLQRNIRDSLNSL